MLTFVAYTDTDDLRTASHSSTAPRLGAHTRRPKTLAVHHAILRGQLGVTPTNWNTQPHDRYLIFAITCPSHGNAGWRWIRDHDPDGWTDAVAFDNAVRDGYPHATTHGQQLRGQYFLHRSCQPLDHVDLDPPVPGKRHLRSVTTPTPTEQDDPHGCPPWSCRSAPPSPGTTPRSVPRDHTPAPTGDLRDVLGGDGPKPIPCSTTPRGVPPARWVTGG